MSAAESAKTDDTAGGAHRITLSREVVGWVLDGLLAFATALFFGLLIDAWKFSPLPPGWDTYWHAYQVKYVLQNWPEISWNPQLAGGMLVFRQYPPVSILLTASLVLLTRLPIGAVMGMLLMVSLGATCVFSYALVRFMTNSRQLGLLAGFLTISSSSLWFWAIFAGNYSRVMSFPLIPLTLLLTLAYVRSPKGGLGFLPAILSTCAGIALHPYTGAAGLLGASVLLLFSSLPASRRILLILLLWFSALLLNAYLFVPYVFLPKSAAVYYTGPTFEYLLHWAGSPTDPAIPLSHILFTTTIAVALLVKRHLSFSIEEKRVFASLGLAVLSLVAFIFAPRDVFGLTAYPEISIVLMPFFLVPMLSLLANLIYRSMKKRTLFTLFLVTLTVSSLIFAGQMHDPLSSVSGLAKYSFAYPDYVSTVAEKLSVGNEESNYRVAIQGGDTYRMYMWFPYYFQVPYTGDGGFSQGRLNNPEDLSFHRTVFEQSTTLPQTSFYLDWWAIKWIVVDRPYQSEVQKFLNTPSTFDAHRIGVGNITEIVYKNTSPIISAVSVPSILIIGPKEESYERLFRAFSATGYSDKKVIPVVGKNPIDDYSTEDMSKFSAIFLFGYTYNDRTKAWGLLRDYVRSGGNLIFDTGFSPDAKSDALPEPSPVASTFWTTSGNDWSFQKQSHPIFDNVSFSSFGRAMIGGNPWGYSTTKNESVREWAKPILWNWKNPVLVVGNYGAGRVVWLGLNLLFHASLYDNSNEYVLLSKIVDWASSSERVAAKFTFCGSARNT